jgi:hypothetical protein
MSSVLSAEGVCYALLATTNPEATPKLAVSRAHLHAVEGTRRVRGGGILEEDARLTPLHSRVDGVHQLERLSVLGACNCSPRVGRSLRGDGAQDDGVGVTRLCLQHCRCCGGWRSGANVGLGVNPLGASSCGEESECGGCDALDLNQRDTWLADSIIAVALVVVVVVVVAGISGGERVWCQLQGGAGAQVTTELPKHATHIHRAPELSRLRQHY